MKLLFFIVNEKAANGRAQKVWKQVKKELEGKNINYRSFQTKYPKHAEELARQLYSLHKNKMEAIIVVGGDGTLHEVVNGLVDHPTVKIVLFRRDPEITFHVDLKPQNFHLKHFPLRSRRNNQAENDLILGKS